MRRSWRILIVLALMAVVVSLVASSALAKGPYEACEKTAGHTQGPGFCSGGEKGPTKWIDKGTA